MNEQGWIERGDRQKRIDVRVERGGRMNGQGWIERERGRNMDKRTREREGEEKDKHIVVVCVQ